ncbi:MAG: hypothetical protein ACRD00_07595 [Thermoanaerobaculia bacterium]
MNHEEYLSLLEDFTDADAGAVLAHVEACASCRRDARGAEASIARLGRQRRSLPEEIARWAAVAAFLALVAFGLRQQALPEQPARVARYRIVGDASGVVAYTPGGIVVGTAARPSAKEIVR